MPQDVSKPAAAKTGDALQRAESTYCVCSHNPSTEEASQELEKLRRDWLPAFTVEQRSRHKAEEAEGCSDCRADVEHAIEAIAGHSEPEAGSPKRQL